MEAEDAERLDLFLLAANGIADADHQRAVFLSFIGPKAYKLHASLVAPRKPGDISYADLGEDNVGSPVPTSLGVVSAFQVPHKGCPQGVDYNVYGGTARAETTLWVWRCAGRHVTRPLSLQSEMHPATPGRTRGEARLQEGPRAHFRRGDNGEELQGAAVAHRESSTGPESVAPALNQDTECFRCGRSNHKPASCKFKKARCHNCGQVGHLKASPSAGPAEEGDKSKKRKESVKTVNSAGLRRRDSIASPAAQAQPIMVDV